ncbi:MAG: phosphoribosyltransferase [Thermoprotei archaeon]
MSKYLSVSWLEVYEALSSIARAISASSSGFDAVLGVARGGWIPARLLSDFLSIRRIVSIQVESYDNEDRKELRILEPVPQELRGSKVLVVDDISDTGSSLLAVVEKLRSNGVKAISTVAIFTKPWSKFTPDFFYKEVSEWVVFPWELNETVIPRLKAGEDLQSVCKELGVGVDLGKALGRVVNASTKTG